MKRISKTAEVPYSARQMYDLVNDFEAYPAFLPGCRSACVLERGDDELKARMELALGGVQQALTTRNRMVPGERIDLELVDGPFRRLHGTWRFRDRPGGGSRVSLEMEFEFSSRLLSMAAGPAFGRLSASLVEAFERRAREVYGRSS